MMKVIFAYMLLLLPNIVVGEIRLVSCDQSCENESSVQLFESCTQSSDLYVFGGGTTNGGGTRRLAYELTEKEQDELVAKVEAISGIAMDDQHRDLQYGLENCFGVDCVEYQAFCCMFCFRACAIDGSCGATCTEGRLRGRQLADAKKHVPDSCEQEFPDFCNAKATCTATVYDMTMGDMEYEIQQYEKLFAELEEAKKVENSKFIKEIKKEDAKDEKEATKDGN